MNIIKKYERYMRDNEKRREKDKYNEEIMNTTRYSWIKLKKRDTCD